MGVCWYDALDASYHSSSDKRNTVWRMTSPSRIFPVFSFTTKLTAFGNIKVKRLFEIPAKFISL